MQGESRKTDLSVLHWMGTLLLLFLPVVNVIMLFVWAFGAHSRSKRNFAIASLIWIVIWIVLCFLALVFYGDAISAWLVKMAA